MREIDVYLGADGEAQDAARFMDWGVVVDSNQGGVSVFVVGLPPEDAAALLRKAADALDAPQTPPSRLCRPTQRKRGSDADQDEGSRGRSGNG